MMRGVLAALALVPQGAACLLILPSAPICGGLGYLLARKLAKKA